MSLFKRRLPDEKKLPILNKAPENPVETQNDTLDDAFQNYLCQNGASTSNQSRNVKHLRRTERKTDKVLEDYIQFQTFAHFAISVKGINELCADSDTDSIDVHLFFEEDFQRLPRIGFSNLSLQDLYEDRALLHDESAKPDNLCFIQFIPLKDVESNDIPNWLVLTPKRGQTLSISLDLADDLGVRVRFSFEGTGPTPWYSDTLFYPCCHLNVHRKCLPTPTVEQCYACREKCEQLISVHQRGTDCLFCDPRNECREFDSFFYPCGCSMGCMDGFKSMSRRMGINCPSCGSVIQNALKIFISNAST
uniref:RING-type domain-containing protein n=1 Tax=Globodera pallida TaxID=36090 RepID=A0A183C4D9_GLOPA